LFLFFFNKREKIDCLINPCFYDGYARHPAYPRTVATTAAEAVRKHHDTAFQFFARGAGFGA
jgi:hypothetical protein